MKYTTPEHTWNILKEHYPDLQSAKITASFIPPKRGAENQEGSWVAYRNGYDLEEVVRLQELGHSKLRFALQTPDGEERVQFDTYIFEIEFRWKPHDELEIYANQAYRKAKILAVVGDEALLEYKLPSGSTSLWIIEADNPHPLAKRTVRHCRCPVRFIEAMKQAGTVWEGERERC